MGSHLGSKSRISFFKNAYGEIHGLSPWRLVDYWTWTKTLEPADYVIR